MNGITAMERVEVAYKIAQIQVLVASHFNVPDAIMTQKNSDAGARLWQNTHPRMIAMYLCRETTKASLSAIGRGFGGRDHSTVHNACNRIEKFCKQDDGWASLVADLKIEVAQ